MERRHALVMAIAFGLVAALLPAIPAHAAYSNSRCGNSSGRALLTFDDWAYGDPYRTTRVGAYLKSRKVRAVFFVLNNEARKYPGIITELRRQGHWVANHTWSHPNLTTLPDVNVRWQIQYGVKSNVLRPPYGAYNTRVQNIATSMGYRICTWTVDTRDWEKFGGRYRSVTSIRSRVAAAPASSLRSGVILGHLHTNYPDAVGAVLDDLIRRGIYPCLNRGPVAVNVPNPLTCT